MALYIYNDAFANNKYGLATAESLVFFVIIMLIKMCIRDSYLRSVQNSLWLKSVTDVLEVTAQGCHALDTYIEKDMETVSYTHLDVYKRQDSFSSSF